MNDFKSVLDAPCVFCNYDGPYFMQKDSHKKSCPFHDIKGHSDRQKALREIITKKFQPKRKKSNEKTTQEGSKTR